MPSSSVRLTMYRRLSHRAEIIRRSPAPQSRPRNPLLTVLMLALTPAGPVAATRPPATIRSLKPTPVADQPLRVQRTVRWRKTRKNSSLFPRNVLTTPPQCVSSRRMYLTNCQKKVKASTKRANKGNPHDYINHCLCCGVWFSGSHTCKGTNRPAKLGKYTFKVPENILELYKGSKANEPNESRDQSVDDKFVKPSNWDFSFFTTIAPEKIFSSPGTIQSLHKETQNAFSLLVKDIIPLVLRKVPGAIEALFLLPRLVAPSNLRGRTATSKILEFISLFRTGQFVPLWERPNIVLRYGSYNPVKRAIALAKAGNLGDAIRALASEGVMHPKECLDILMTLHPQAPPPAPPCASFTWQPHAAL